MGEQRNDRSLHRALAQHFSLDELKLLCFNTGIDPETVPYAERGKEVFAYCLVETLRSKSLCHPCCKNVRWLDLK